MQLTDKVELIFGLVSDAYGVEDLKDVSRRQRLVQARNVAFAMLYRNTRMSTPDIGDLFAKNHTTVLHGIAQADQVSLAKIQEQFDDASNEPDQFSMALRQALKRTGVRKSEATEKRNVHDCYRGRYR